MLWRYGKFGRRGCRPKSDSLRLGVLDSIWDLEVSNWICVGGGDLCKTDHSVWGCGYIEGTPSSQAKYDASMNNIKKKKEKQLLKSFETGGLGFEVS